MEEMERMDIPQEAEEPVEEFKARIVDEPKSESYGEYGTYTQQAAPVLDSGSIGWAILGFFIPIVGIILFFVWQKNKPKCAKKSIIGAAVGFAFNLLVMLF